jgi:hypothetical protein
MWSSPPFATVRLRTTAAKWFKKVENATALVWKLLQVAESTFQRFKGAELLPAVYAGAQYVDGVKRSLLRPDKVVACSLSRSARRSKETACAVRAAALKIRRG